MAMDSDTWCTPAKIATPLFEFFEGPVDVDPCSNANSIIKARKIYTEGGLHLPWRLPGRKAKRTVYKNNPYSRSGIWVAKSLREQALGNVREQVSLMMVAPSTQWWIDFMAAPINPRVLCTPRLKFIGDKDCGARFDTALIYHGPADRVPAFEQCFAAVTRWTSWGR